MNYKIILTGGYANFFKNKIKKTTIVIKTLQLKVYQEFIENYYE